MHLRQCHLLYNLHLLQNVGEKGTRLDDRFQEHLRGIERNDKDTSRPVARHFNLPNHSKHQMEVFGLSFPTDAAPQFLEIHS